MTTETLARTPAGPIEPIQNLKRRKLRVWWRPHINPDGEKIWIETKPLPDDLSSREAYLAKGFRMTQPKPGDVSTQAGDPEKEALYAEIATLQSQVKELTTKKKGKKA